MSLLRSSSNETKPWSERHLGSASQLSSASAPRVPSCYARHSLVAVDEDAHHEFKAHRSLSAETESEHSTALHRDGQLRVSKVAYGRAPITKSLCALLNAGEGGTIFIGITDGGRVEGVALTTFQRDHLNLAVKDLLGRYSPPVPDHLYSLHYVPVVDPDESDIGAEKAASRVVLRKLEAKRRLREHELRSTRYCWCDGHAMALMERGLLPEFFVVQIQIAKWDASDAKNECLGADLKKTGPQLNPIFANEEQAVFLRYNGYTRKLPFNEVHRLVRQRIQLQQKRSSKSTRSSSKDVPDDDSLGEHDPATACEEEELWAPRASSWNPEEESGFWKTVFQYLFG